MATQTKMSSADLGGARRWWVDQNGTPATPWRFINLGTKPGGNEGARAAPSSPGLSVTGSGVPCREPTKVFTGTSTSLTIG